MANIKHFLLAVGTTEHSSKTVEQTIKLAKEFNATVSLLNVITDYAADHERTRSEVKKYFDTVKQRLEDQGIRMPHNRIGAGVIEDITMEYALEIGADAIIVGVGNKPGGPPFRLGGHAEAILRYSKVPVIVLKDEVLSDSSKIVCPIDLTPDSKETLLEAIKISKELKKELVILHVVEPNIYGYPGLGIEYSYAVQNHFNDSEKAFEIFLKDIDFQGLPYTSKILEGVSSIEISRYINSAPFYLTVLKSATRSGISRLILGSVAESVTKGTKTPVLVFK